jgi:alpha-tubulin suppressor-like RCC1 family protein
MYKESEESNAPEENNLCVWGDNSFGQLAFDNANNELKVFVPKMLSFGIHIVEISCGFEHSLLRSIKGELYSVGNNKKGQLGIGKKFKRKMAPTMVNLDDPNEKILLASAQGDHNIAYSEFGRIYAWGDNSFGQLGTGDLESREVPADITKRFKIGSEESVITISCGRDHSLILLNTLRCMAWGSNQFYQLGLDSKTNESVLIPTETVVAKVKGIAAGYEHTLFLDQEGGVWVTGNNDNERLIPGKKAPRIKAPTKIEIEEPVKRVFASNLNCVITEKNNLYLWGCFMDQVLPLFNPFEESDELEANPSGHTKKSQNRSSLKYQIETAGLGENFVIAADEFGDCFAWGFNGNGELGQTLEGEKTGQTVLSFPKRLEILSPFEVKSIYTGRNFAYTIIVERAGEPELADGNLIQYGQHDHLQNVDERGFGGEGAGKDLESDAQSSGGSHRGKSIREEEASLRAKPRVKPRVDYPEAPVGTESTPRESVDEIRLNMDPHSLDVVRILVFLYESLRFHLIKIIDDTIDVDATLPPELIDLIKRQQDIIDDYILRCGLKIDLNFEIDNDSVMELKYPEGLKLLEGLPRDLGSKTDWTSSKVETSTTQQVVHEQAKTKKLKTETLIKLTQMMSMLGERIPELKRVLKVK